MLHIKPEDGSRIDLAVELDFGHTDGDKAALGKLHACRDIGGFVNPTEQRKSITLKLDQGKLAGHGRQWIITGPDKWAYNAPGKARQVDIVHTSLTTIPKVLELAPLSVTLYFLELQ